MKWTLFLCVTACIILIKTLQNHVTIVGWNRAKPETKIGENHSENLKKWFCLWENGEFIGLKRWNDTHKTVRWCGHLGCLIENSLENFSSKYLSYIKVKIAKIVCCWFLGVCGKHWKSRKSDERPVCWRESSSRGRFIVRISNNKHQPREWRSMSV